jgi:hypothetical protein
MQAFVANNSDFDLNPLIRTTTSTTRQWLGTDFNFLAHCDLTNPNANLECGPMNDKSLGTPNFNRTYDPNFIDGWDVRPYNWQFGVGVQQELAPRVSLNVGYVRNWWGNWYVVENQATSLSDYTPFSILAPLDQRLPGGGGQTISGLYNLVPGKVGQVSELAQLASNFAKQIENWQGVDINLIARLRNGLTVQGGTSTGRRLVDACAVRASLPELGSGVNGTNNSITANVSGASGLSVTNPWCRIVEPYLTSIRGLATYTIPKVGVQVSGTLSSNPGPMELANYVASNAVIAAGPQPLGRALTGGSNVTVNLVQPGTLYGPRISTLDFRAAKILRYGRTRAQIGVDVYNLKNTDVATSYNNTFVQGGTWLTPSTILPARYAKISAQFDF